MGVRVWKKVNSPRPVRIWPPSRRVTKRSASRPPKVKARKRATVMSSKMLTHLPTTHPTYHKIHVYDPVIFAPAGKMSFPFCFRHLLQKIHPKSLRSLADLKL